MMDLELPSAKAATGTACGVPSSEAGSREGNLGVDLLRRPGSATHTILWKTLVQ